MTGVPTWFVAVLQRSLALAGPAVEVSNRYRAAFDLHGGFSTEAGTGAPLGLIRLASLDVLPDRMVAWVAIAEDEWWETLVDIRLRWDATHYAHLSRDRRFLRLLGPCDLRAFPQDVVSLSGMLIHHHKPGLPPQRQNPPTRRARKVAPLAPRQESRYAMLDREGASAARFIAGVFAVRLRQHLKDRLPRTPEPERDAR